MAASIDDYAQTYQQALTAYAQQNYELAATLVDEVVANVPNDPNTRLLRGHVYYVLQKFDIAKSDYEEVLRLTQDSELIGLAQSSLDNISQYLQELEAIAGLEEISTDDVLDFAQTPNSEANDAADLGLGGIFDDQDLALNAFTPIPETGGVVEGLPDAANPFEMPTDSIIVDKNPDSTSRIADNPFALEGMETDGESVANSWIGQSELELPSFLDVDIPSSELGKPDLFSSSLTQEQSSDSSAPSLHDFLFAPVDSLEENLSSSVEKNSYQAPSMERENPGKVGSKVKQSDDETLLMGTPPNPSKNSRESSPTNSQEKLFSTESATSKSHVDKFPGAAKSAKPEENPVHHFDDDNDSFDMEAFESAFGSEVFSTSDDSILNGKSSQTSTSKSVSSNIEFLDDFDDFDDLGNIPGFDISTDTNFGNSQPLSSASIASKKSSSTSVPKSSSNFPDYASTSGVESDRDDELFSITGSQEAVPVFTQVDASNVEPQVSVEQGIFAPLENAPLETKQWLIAGSVGVFSAFVVALVSFAATNFSPPQQRESVRNTGWAMALGAGIAGFATAGFMGNLTMRQIRRTTKDLKTQFEAVRQGNLNAQATVYSEDEFGQLAAGFNEMARVILTTTSEANRKANEQEEAKENLQRQVIRLLDDVEGAARGDLTVQAEVTADVLGAVADAFNLTIQNLRDIVQQVKVAAREVTKGATNSETFARALSSDALRQAEELAVTLQSVQVMTDSIQRVAEAARQAEAVARDASEIALKGGDAVENTVAGILEIRETVAETTRKVKRLAESSQEISKIVALISQIASRTNLLALNASIEAARAGEAGRGFAIVADEVRQLADKSAKSLKEIEQIVMQIQSETGSVMTAMEEGTQQVIKGTKLAEEAKRSLENIIQVANRIDGLVRSITSDTVEQTETSRAVAQVMQSVELTAQETSQEAQRVSGALQHLVGVSRDLITSVERFRVETSETR